MTINEMIRKYSITLVDGNGLSVVGSITPKEIENLKLVKDDIIAELKNRKETEENERKEAAERLAANVPGLEALRKIRNEWESYNHKLSRYIENDLLGAKPVKPSVEAKEIAFQYPVAVAYLKAEAYEYASNYAKSSAGKKAKQRIANGEDYNMALADMETEWTQHVEGNMWN